MSHFGGASAVAGAAGAFGCAAAFGRVAPLAGGAAAVLPCNGGLPAAAGGAGRTACTGGLASIGGSATPVTAASGRAAGRSASQSMPNMTLQSATARTAQTAMDFFVLSDSGGNMEPSQRWDHTAGSALTRKAGL